MKKKKLREESVLFGISEKEFTKGQFIEGAVVRPGILFFAFASFVVALFLLLLGNLKWGGTLVVISFIANMYSIYLSLGDKPSVYRNMNIAFKLILFVAEIISFSWVLALVI